MQRGQVNMFLICSKLTRTLQKSTPSFEASLTFSLRVGYFFLRNFASSAAL